MYAKVENGVVIKYPLSEGQVRAAFPNISFAPDFANNLPDGYVRVLLSGVPKETETQRFIEATPELIDGAWVQKWVAEDKYTPDEWQKVLELRESNKWSAMRDKRDVALIKSDWVVARHKEQKEIGQATTISEAEYLAWLTYRQELRDFPSIVTDIDNYTLPTAPGQLGISNG